MKKVTLSLDSSLKEIFTYEESRAVFDKFLPGMRTMAENQPAALGFSVRKILQFSGGAIPAEAADALDAALCALELYSAEPEMSDTPLTPDGAEVVPEPPRDAIYPGKVWRDTNGRRIYNSKADLAAALNINELHTAEQFEGLARTDKTGKKHNLLGIFVNLSDYTVGSTKGGEITRFNQFDIDFNQEKYLIETRLSGALTRLWSAIALEEPVKASSGQTEDAGHDGI